MKALSFVGVNQKEVVEKEKPQLLKALMQWLKL